MIVRKEVNWKGTEGYRGSIHTQPWVNVKETEASFWVEVAAPGLAKSDFGIEVKDQTLLISVEKELGENSVNVSIKWLESEAERISALSHMIDGTQSAISLASQLRQGKTAAFIKS